VKLLALAVLVAVVVGGLVGTLLVRDPGYVLVTYADTVVETSLWVALLSLSAFYFVLRVVIYLVRTLGRGQLKILRWSSGRRARSAQKQTVRGLLVMAEGRWEEAKKLLASAADDVESPLINFLTAARAAHELDQAQERDGFLKRAHETTPGAKFAATLTQAEFHISENRYEQALAALLTLRKRAPKHRAVLAMLLQCFEALEDWPALKTGLAQAVKHKAVSTTQQIRLQRLVWGSLLKDGTDPSTAWKKLPKELKNDTELVNDWIAHLILKNDGDKTEQAIRLAVSHQWRSSLVKLYGEVRSSDPHHQLVIAQSWLKSRPNDANLNLTLGRLCLLNELFEQGREYFEASLRLAPTDETYGELGRLCVALGDERRGCDYLLQSLGNLPSLPQPATPTIRKVGAS